MPAQPGEDPDEPLAEVHLAELRHLLAELALALLGPDPRGTPRSRTARAVDDRPARRLDDGPQPGPVDRDERVAEVEA